MVRGLDIVIVNWFAGQLLERCLASIGTCPDENIDIEKVLLVDHGSKEGELDRLKALPLPLQIIAGHGNPGYGAGANRGAAAGKAEYILFLNPDVALEPGCLSAAVDWLDSAKGASTGIVGLAHKNPAGDIARSCARFPTPARLLGESTGLSRLFPGLIEPLFLRDWDHGESRDVDHVMGAFWVMRRRDFETLNGFDEDFFVYLEDMDLSKRARQAGLGSRYLSAPSVRHVGGGTTRRLSEGQRLALWIDARLVYAKKHFTPAGRLVTWAAVFLMEPPTRLVQALLQAAPKRGGAVIEGYYTFLRHNRGRDLGRGAEKRPAGVMS